jgi:hypothetical protein
MYQANCHRCGGFMSYRKRVTYRLPSATTPRVTAHGGVCSCSVPILDGPPPGFASLPAMPSVRGLPTSGNFSRPGFRKHYEL